MVRARGRCWEVLGSIRVRGGLSEEVTSEDRPEGVSEPLGDPAEKCPRPGDTVSAKALRWDRAWNV